MSYDDEYDVIVAGSGVGGLSAAITAAEQGARVLVLEKFNQLGGVTALSSGHLWPGPNTVSEKLGYKDSVSEAQTYLDHVSQGLSKESLRNKYLAGSRDAIQFFTEKIGLELTVIRGLCDYYYPQVMGSKVEGRYLEVKPFSGKRLGEWADKVITSPYTPGYSYVTGTEWVESQYGRENLVEALTGHLTEDERCGGAGLSAALVLAALERKVEFRLSTAVTKLLTTDDDRVIGVVAKQAATDTTAKRSFRFRSLHGLVLATGGYDCRKDFMKAFDGLTDTATMVLPSVTGDHIVLASSVGAIPVPTRLPGQSPIFMGYPVPGEIIYGKPSSRLWTVGQPHSMVVNSTGQRFADDGFYVDVVLKVNQYGGQNKGMTNWPAWMIFDQSMLDKYGLQPAAPGQALPKGMAKQANTIAELAKISGIDASLSKTVERFNGFCKSGIDTDFARGNVRWAALMSGDLKMPNPNLGEIAKAPFYAIKLQHVSIGTGTTGLPIDGNGRVFNAAGGLVEGLYATGNSTAWQDWGGGLNSGVAGMRGMLYGYRAALEMTGTSVKL